MAVGPRRQSALLQKCLDNATTASCNAFMMEGLHHLGTQNGNPYGMSQCYMLVISNSRKHSPPTASHFPLFISSGAPLSRIRGCTIITFSFCGMSFCCVLNVIYQASQLKNG